MFPAPTTIAISTPSAWTATISSATASIVARSIPYSRSPISDSPESFSRMRRKTGRPASARATVSSDCTAISADQREALELQHLRALFAEHLADRLGGVVDPLLVRQDAVGEEALVEHALDDLLARLLGLGLDLVRVAEDLALRRDHVLGDVVAPDPLRRGCGDVHRELAREVLRAAAQLHEYAELVRRRMDVALDHRAVDRFEGHRSDDHDVLADLRDQVVPFDLEIVDLLREIRAVRGFEHALRERAELLVLRHGLRLAADRDQRSDAVPDLEQDDTLRRRAPRALRRARLSALA